MPGHFSIIGDDRDTGCHFFEKGHSAEVNGFETKQLEHYGVSSASQKDIIGIKAWTSDVKILFVDQKQGKLSVFTELTGNKKRAISIGFSPEGDHVATVSEDHELVVWRLNEYSLSKDNLYRGEVPENTTACSTGVSDKGDHMVAIAVGQDIKVYTLKEGSLNEVHIIEGVANTEINRLDFFLNDHKLYLASSAHQDGRINIWKVE